MQVQGLHLNEDSVLAYQKVMEPSPLSPRSRHGRSKHGGSISRARASSNTDAREVSITKALTWILKRGGSEKRAEDGIDIQFDEDGWADCGEVVSMVASNLKAALTPRQLQWPNLSMLKPTIGDLQALLANNPRQKFSIKLKADAADPFLASSWLVRASSGIASPSGTRLTSDSADLPEVVIYSTTYSTYAHILASGTLRNTGGGNVSFSTSLPDELDAKAEVIVYIDLHKALATPKAGLQWYMNENETTVTVAEGKGVSKEFWLKVVGRKGDVGLLWADGEIVRDIPMGVRGKKVGGGKKDLKGRNGRGKGGRSLSFSGNKKSSEDDGSE